MRITDGAGVNVVYDSVGKTAFDESIECLQRFGCMILLRQCERAGDGV